MTLHLKLTKSHILIGPFPFLSAELTKAKARLLGVRYVYARCTLGVRYVHVKCTLGVRYVYVDNGGGYVRLHRSVAKSM